MQQLKKRKANNSNISSKKTRYGDTIVEAIIAISIYSIVAVLALSMMNSGLSRAQKNLESTMSRLAIDSQSDTLRYIYEAYITGLKRDRSSEGDFFRDVWNTKRSGAAGALPAMYTVASDSISNVNEAATCDEALKNDREKYPVFVLNPRALASVVTNSEWRTKGYYGFGSDALRSTLINNVVVFDNGGYEGAPSSKIATAPLYPRLSYATMLAEDGSMVTSDYGMDILAGNGGKSGVVNADGTEESTVYLQSNILQRSEGVWVFGLKRNIASDIDQTSYDFYIRTCWNAVGAKAPSTTSTVVRLYEYGE